jgi:universal stress protein A
MTSDIKRILVPLDFSAGSRRALDQALEIARRFDASIHLIHVCDRPAMMAAAVDGCSIAPWEGSRALGVNAAAQLGEIARRLRGLRVSTEVRFGEPAPIIVETATACRADLIVVGTHGHGALTRVALGSVAERIVRLAPCPVLTVRRPGVPAVENSYAKKMATGVAKLAMLAVMSTERRR